jgi:hypothetical protein
VNAFLLIQILSIFHLQNTTSYLKQLEMLKGKNHMKSKVNGQGLQWVKWTEMKKFIKSNTIKTATSHFELAGV